LIVVDAIAILVFFGLGFSAHWLFFQLWPESRNFALNLFIVSSTALLFNYGLTLTGLSFDTVLFLEAPFAVLGWCLLIFNRLKLGDQGRKTTLGAAAVLALLYILRVLSEPNRCYDANLIWFFSSKVMANKQTLFAPECWADPLLKTAHHTDYPKIVGVIGGQIAYHLGFWNEIAPRFALLFIFLPTVFGVLAEYRRSLVYYAFATIFLFRMGDYAWNGCQDAHFAFLGALATWFFARFFATRDWSYLLAATIGTAVASNIKNEGLLFTVSVGFAFVLTLLLSRKQWSLRALRPLHLLSLAPLFFPAIAWHLLKKSWHIVSDFQFGTSAWGQLTTRISSWNNIELIFRWMFIEPQLWRIVLAIMVFYWFGGTGWTGWFSKVGAPAQRTMAPAPLTPLGHWPMLLLTPTIYSLGIFCIYLITPYELYWHVTQSAGRTVLVIQQTLFVIAFVLVSGLTSGHTSGFRGKDT
jgi:hypothetical protein